MRTPSTSLFLRCRHPRLPKYPPMPVLRCAGFVPRDAADAEGATAG